MKIGVLILVGAFLFSFCLLGLGGIGRGHYVDLYEDKYTIK